MWCFYIHKQVAVWRSWLDQRRYSTPGPVQVSTGMGDRIGVQLPVWENLSQPNQPPKPTQPGHPSVGRHYKYRLKGGDALRLRVKTDMVLLADNTV